MGRVKTDLRDERDHQGTPVLMWKGWRQISENNMINKKLGY